MMSESQSLALYYAEGNGLQQHATQPRLKKPGKGKWTPETCKAAFVVQHESL
jgi:hypothetical protein